VHRIDAPDRSDRRDSSTEAVSQRYRVLILSGDGHVVETIGFTAPNDDVASAIAESMVDGYSAELWKSTRGVSRSGSGEGT
jgi:hypothetical protein